MDCTIGLDPVLVGEEEVFALFAWVFLNFMAGKHTSTCVTMPPKVEPQRSIIQQKSNKIRYVCELSCNMKYTRLMKSVVIGCFKIV